MPGDHPQPTGHAATHGGIFDIFGAPARASRSPGRGLRSAVLKPALATTALACAFAALAAPALAQTSGAAQFFNGLLSSTGVMLLAVFGGAMSFALMSASWLILERSRITGENAELKARIADLRAANERADALVNISDQRIVVWNGSEDRPTLLGRLSRASGAPDDRAGFLAFGRWLAPDSAISFEGALKRLRCDAEAFDLPLVTRAGGVVEAQGRTSGGYAFVRFVELSGERSMLSRLEAEHTRLLATFDTIQALFEILPMPVWLKDAVGELYWANTAYARAVDRADGEQAVSDRVHLLDSAQRREVSAREREQGHFTGALPAVVAGDRRMLDVFEVKTQAGLAGMAADRSEIEAVRATLEQTIASHRQTLDHLATPIAMFDKHQRLQFCNSSFQKLWGLSEALLQNQPSNGQLLDALREKKRLPERPDWRKWRKSQLEIYQAVEPRQEFWHLTDGQTLRVIVNPQREGGVTWLFEDVTEQLALQSNYNALIRIQGETLDHLSEAVAVFGLDGRLRLCNPAFVALWQLDDALAAAGTHVSALSGSCRARLSDDAGWDEIAEAVTDVEDLRGDRRGRLETVDGAVIDFSLVRLPEGQTMLTLMDMTAAVNVERALKEKNEALEQSDLLKNRFIQHVSYELRAPLTSIAGFSEMLAMSEIGQLNAKQAEYVGHISSAAAVLKTIIDDILDLATIDAGAMKLEIATTPLRPIIDTTLEQLQEQISKHGLKTQVQLGERAQSLDADPERVGQILSNLLSNAVAASPDGGTISVSADHVGDMVEIAVADEGPGVPREDRQSIFGRFEGRPAGNRRRGAGLGLSIVKAFVELHGGTVHVEDAGKRGARFVCRLPMARKAARAA